VVKYWERFKSLKERGEWVELQFMAEAARRRFAVCRPWGDSRAYDVGIEHGANFLRVQVKSASCRMGCGYWCGFTPHYNKKQDYSVKEIDLFAAYVIPVRVCYLIPAGEMLGVRRRKGTMLFPVVLPVRKNSFRYECYREAWQLLARSRRELAKYGR